MSTATAGPSIESVTNKHTTDAATSNYTSDEAKDQPKISVEECIIFFKNYLNKDREALKTFYKDEDLSEPGKKAKSMFETLIGMRCKKETARQLILLILYDIVMLIDDSRSMKTEQGGERIKTLHSTIDAITRVYDLANENGMKSVEFFNGDDGIENVKNKNWEINFNERVYNGVTKIGTSLSQKILNRFVWGREMKKPLLVMIITDGDVEGERAGLLEDVIGGCIDRLAKDDERGSQAVSFHFSLVGNDRDAQRLLKKLDNSKTLGHHVDCVSASDTLEALRDTNSERGWSVLPKILLGGISTYWDRELESFEVDSTANPEAASQEYESDVDAVAGSSDYCDDAGDA
ncbi:hypothetical protein DFP73DRAFT_634587 [Morchella snyderi]|nr:hypothetical protein DFP73DRAFT_634587 [Morchella snyderi]